MKVTYGAIVQRARGRFGGTVHSNWKGIDVVRRFAKPSNPNSAGQQNVRTAFRQLTSLYGLLPTETKAAWTTFATGKPFIARNKLIAVNVPLLNAEVNYADLQPTPGDSSTLPPTAFAPVGGNDQITTSITTPTVPTGWTITGCVACCITADAVPTDPNENIENLRVFETIHLTNPYAPTITGLAAGDYFTWAFIKWLAPDGTTRYSPPLAGGSITVT